jgi:DNA-binding NarL/FixJ family response regulator
MSEIFGGIVPKVMIVDDHTMIRRGVQSLLQPFPEWELCGEAQNGAEAVRLAQELEPEVIIMDLSMPGMDGVEATRAIRKILPGVKVLMLTLHRSKEQVELAFGAGVRGYMLKTEALELPGALKLVVADEGIYVSRGIDMNLAKKAAEDAPKLRARRGV